MIPTLVVPGHPDEWLPHVTVDTHDGDRDWKVVEAPARCWVPVVTLPEVTRWHDHGGGFSQAAGPLRAGDTVELAAYEGWPYIPVPCARATVAEVLPVAQPDVRGWGRKRHIRIARNPRPGRTHTIQDPRGWPVAVDLPGDWSSARFGVRVTDVEALT